jgi:sodium ion-translocating decarboxylase beta subunit
MIDFTPLLAMPYTVLLGAAGQFGIYGTLMLALALGFPMNQAASIGVIGAIDGPTAIFVSKILAPELLGPIAVAAYSYMSLIPIIQPPIMKLLTTKKERAVRMEYSVRPVSHRALLVFPIVVTIFISMLAPQAAPLIATLMLGNLLRVAGVVERLNKTAQNELINIATLFLGFPELENHWRTCPGFGGVRAGYCGGNALRQVDVLRHPRQDQPAHRRLRHQRFPHGCPNFSQGGAGRGFR